MLKSDHQTEIPTLSTARCPQAAHKLQNAHVWGTGDDDPNATGDAASRRSAEMTTAMMII